MWSTFEFDIPSRTATVWMSQGVMENMLKKGWAVALYTTNTWKSAVTQMELLQDVCERKERWVDWSVTNDGGMVSGTAADSDIFGSRLRSLSVASLD